MSTANPNIPEASQRRQADISPQAVESRLAALRERIPQALVQIDAVRADDTAIAVKATIGLPGGARHSHIAAADVDGNSSWAGQLATVQAMAIAHVLDGLQQRPAQPSGSTVPEAPATQQPPATPAPAEEDHLPEYSWNAFWQTINSRGITREQVEQALGKSVQEVTPKEAVDALKAAGLLT